MTENVVPIGPDPVVPSVPGQARSEPAGVGRAATPRPDHAQPQGPASQYVDLFPKVESGREAIEDPEFIAALNRLRGLSSFILQVAAPSDEKVRQAARLGGLNQLRRAFPSKGRAAEFEEWQAVEIRTQVIWGALSDAHRRKFLATQTPGWISYLISAFIVVAAASLVVAVLTRTGAIRPIAGGILIPFLLWIIALGAIGAAASIGMNALSVQDDATFDVSSGKFIWLRLVLGALFGTVLTLPLGFDTFDTFLVGFGEASAPPETAEVAKQAGLLLLPFILGFSTSLVILVLNRLIESAQTFFGKPSKAA